MDSRRRNVLRATGLLLSAGIAGCSDQSGGGTGGSDGGGSTDGEVTETETATATATETETETQTASDSSNRLVIDNVSVQAWKVVEDETGSVAPTGTENPTMTFEVGQRYAVENRGWSAHPFALRAADDTPLLSQSANGKFEDDADVEWVDSGDSLAFTVTDGLASAVDYYICTVHSSMRGSVETVS